MSVRFAPSPTGRFHIGNLRTAWISHRFARLLGMPWVVRFENIDQPRVLPGAMEKQLEDMKALGMTPDKALLQTDFAKRHEILFQKGVASGKIYPCTCSRKEVLQSLQEMASAPHEEVPIYNGRCRNIDSRPKEISHPTIAWRFHNPENGEGRHDFIVARTDADGANFVPSYHWACAIDDYDGDHALLVRASDLAHVIPQQCLIHRWVGETSGHPRGYPAVFHTSLVIAENESRLEKRTRGVTLPEILANGATAAAITQGFARSFDESAIRDFASGRIWSEASEKIKLSQLTG